MGAIFLFIILLLIILLMFWAFSRTTTSKPFVSEQKVKVIFLTYVGILLISTIVYTVLPKEYYSLEIDGNNYEIDKRELEMGSIVKDEPDIYDAVMRDALDETEGIMKKETWEFPYDGNMLIVTENENFGTTIFLEEKETTDDQIEVAYYMTKPTVDGIDLSEQIKIPQIRLIEEQLQIYHPKRLEIKFHRFEKEAVIGQFFGEPWYDHFGYYNVITTGQHMLYVKVPKSLKIKDDNVYIVYVSELREEMDRYD